MKRVAIALGIFLDIVLAAWVYGGQLYAMGWALLFGWMAFLGRTLPQVEVNWIGVATGLGFLSLLLIVLDRFARWFCRAVPADSPRHWHLRWTLAIVTAFFLMFAVGYSTIGLARHIGWIVSSRAPCFDIKLKTYGKIVDD